MFDRERQRSRRLRDIRLVMVDVNKGNDRAERTQRCLRTFVLFAGAIQGSVAGIALMATQGKIDEPEAVRQMIRNHNKSNVVIHTIAFENEEGGDICLPLFEPGWAPPVRTDTGGPTMVPPSYSAAAICEERTGVRKAEKRVTPNGAGRQNEGQGGPGSGKSSRRRGAVGPRRAGH